MALRQQQKSVFKLGAFLIGVPVLIFMILSLTDGNVVSMSGSIQSILALVYLFGYFVAFPMFMFGIFVVLGGIVSVLWGLRKQKVE